MDVRRVGAVVLAVSAVVPAFAVPRGAEELPKRYWSLDFHND
jgi:hypothetical protein